MKKSLEELRQAYLLKIYEIAGGNVYSPVGYEKLQAELGLTEREALNVVWSFRGDHLVNANVCAIMLTPDGIMWVEKYMEKSYAEKEYLMLKTIYEMGKNNTNRGVDYFTLLDELGFDDHEFNLIHQEIERKGFLSGVSDGCLTINGRGLAFLDQYHNPPPVNAANVNNFNFHGSVTGFQNQTQNSVQNIKQTNIINNPEFNSAIQSLTELIKDSSLNKYQREDFISELQRIEQLAKEEQTPELVEHAKSKILTLENGLKLTDLAIKAAPLIQQLMTAFGD